MRNPEFVLITMVLCGVGGCGKPSQPIERHPLVGTVHPALPMETGGMVIIGPDGALTDFAVSEVISGDTRMLWLDSLTSRNPAGNPQWKIIDVVILPTLQGTESLERGDCFLDGKPDPSIIALGTWKHDDSISVLTSIRHAWRPNLKTLQFEPLPVDAVECRYDEDRT